MTSTAASGALVGAVGGPDALLWVLAAVGVCSLADVLAPKARSGWHLGVRYLSSVAVTMAASHVAAAWVSINYPEWAAHGMEVRIGAALAAGVFLHPVISSVPAFVTLARNAFMRRLGGSPGDSM